MNYSISFGKDNMQLTSHVRIYIFEHIYIHSYIVIFEKFIMIICPKAFMPVMPYANPIPMVYKG